MSVQALELSSAPVAKSLAPVRKWLWWIAFLIFVMVVVGGATRLTDSGLSITVWDPIIGAIPPLNSAEWQKAFALYQATSEYQIQNKGMSLGEFQYIFWWEWAHRFLGRIIGVVFALPFLYFLVTRRMTWALASRLLLLFLLGAAQGALGWYMVKSGLVDRVDVSQYRLVAHLTMACLLFAAVVWVALGIEHPREFSWRWPTVMSVFLLVLVFVQIAAGGFMAGLDAGHVSHEWPKMNGVWVPDGLDTLKPIWLNWFENAVAVHFNHRVLAYGLLLFAIMHAWSTFRFTSLTLAYLIFVQACLGVMTVWMGVRLGYALAHQATAMAVLALAVANVHSLMAVRSFTTEPVQDRQ